MDCFWNVIDDRTCTCRYHVKNYFFNTVNCRSDTSQATELGSSILSGSNVSITTEGGLGSLTAGSAVGYTATDYSAPTDGTAYSFSEAFTEGDATPSNTTITSGVAPSLPAFGSVTTTAGGVAGDLAGSIDSSGALSLTAGGAGTSATGQFVTEITVK